MSICIYGHNIIPEIPSLKPGKDVAIQIPDLSYEIDETIRKINSTTLSDEQLLSICIWIMKRFVRSGFELISFKEQSFTRNLYTCWYFFSKYYPQKKKQMYQALFYSINPTTNKNTILKIINDIGVWLVKKYEENPGLNI